MPTNASSLNETLCACLANTDVDDRDVEDSSDSIRLHRFDNDHIEHETRNHGFLRVQVLPHNPLKLWDLYPLPDPEPRR